MKVLIIPSWYPYPSMPHAGRFFVEQAQALAKIDHLDVSILNWGQNALQLKLREPIGSMVKLLRYHTAQLHPSNISQELKEITIPHLTWTSHLLGANISSLADKIDLKEKPDIIHAHVSFPAGYLAMLLSQRYGIPYIITEHSGPFPLREHIRHGKLSPLVSNPLSKAAKVVAVSSHLSAEIFMLTGISPTIIPNMVDTDYFSPSSPDRDEQEPIRFFSLGSLTEAKGALDLVMAAKMLKDKGVSFTLRCGGSGVLENRLKSLITKFDLQNQVTLLGRLNKDDTLNEYRNCDCFVLPSHVESFSMVLIEAMACGVPLIATACGGPQDIVSDACGILIPPQSPHKLCEGMQYMAEHCRGYDRTAIRKLCVDRYSSIIVTQQIEQLYRWVLNRV